MNSTTVPHEYTMLFTRHLDEYQQEIVTVSCSVCTKIIFGTLYCAKTKFDHGCYNSLVARIQYLSGQNHSGGSIKMTRILFYVNHIEIKLYIIFIKLEDYFKCQCTLSWHRLILKHTNFHNYKYIFFKCLRYNVSYS